MTIEEMKKRLQEFCDAQKACRGCPLEVGVVDHCGFNEFSDDNVNETYNIVFGGKEEVFEKDCNNCRYADYDENDRPCRDCGYFDMWVSRVQTAEQSKEEINHPDRYAGGKFECIDVMLDVFGADAVKHFCILNAFKYLWRSEKKNGVEDIKKAVWYLNKYIELGGGKNEG